MKPLINMRQIEVFRAIMLSGSVVGAAKLLNVTQPGISRTLGLLELHVGYALFERRGRRIVPTPEAEALYREVERVYVGIDHIGQVAVDIRFHRAGALRIATLPALAQWMIPEAIAQFLKTRPKVSMFVQSLPSRQIADMVATRQLDLGIVELPLTRPGIHVRPLPPVPIVAVVQSDHRLAKKRTLSLKDLHGERMVLLSPHSYVRYQIDDAFSSLGVFPQVIIETPTSSLAYALVAAGAGITLVSRWTTRPSVEPGLVVVPLKESLSSRYAIIVPGDQSPMALPDEFARELETLATRLHA